MFTWLATLPLVIKITIFVAFIAVMVTVAIFGKIKISWGKIRLDLGYNRKERSCKDCAIILRARGVKASRKVDKIERLNLKQKMNFAEQQLAILQRILFIEYTKAMKDKNTSPYMEEKEISTYHTKLEMAISILKDELRRAFKENGFHTLDNEQFKKYIQDESQILIDTYCEYMLSSYPSGMTVKYEDLLNITENNNDIMKECFSAIITKSKDIELKTIKEITAIEEIYEHETNEFLQLSLNDK